MVLNLSERDIKRIQEKIAQAKEEKSRIKQEKAGERRFNRYYLGVCGLLVVGTIAVSAYFEFGKKDENRVYTPPVAEIAVKSEFEDAVANEAGIVVPAKISFEQAQANIRNIPYVQKYLDQLVEEEAKVTKTWQGFDRVIYDPEYKQFEKDAGEKARIRGGYHDNNEGIASFAITGRDPGKKTVCYASYRCLHPANVVSEDELKSLLDNESFHAYESWKGIRLNKSGLSDEEFKNIINSASDEVKNDGFELLSFDYQFYLVMKKKKRKVRKEFIDSLTSEYMKLYRRFEELSKKDSIDGKYAKMIFDGCGKIKKGR